MAFDDRLASELPEVDYSNVPDVDDDAPLLTEEGELLSGFTIVGTPAFEPAIAYELDTYFVCTAQRCARRFNYGNPKLCPMCGAPTVERSNPPRIVHGASGYTNNDCRCDICRAAHSQSAGAYRAKRKR
jgi:hypothetical protein